MPAARQPEINFSVSCPGGTGSTTISSRTWFSSSKFKMFKLRSEMELGVTVDCCLAGSASEGNSTPATSIDISGWRRSEEHTSELQSHLNLVCRLLLEETKKNSSHAVSTTLMHRRGAWSDLRRR